MCTSQVNTNTVPNPRLHDSTPNGVANTRRIINVTHMIPYNPIAQNVLEQSNDIQWTLKSRRGHSALYSGIRSLRNDWDNYHVGYIGPVYDVEEKPIDSSRLTDDIRKKLDEFLAQHKVVPVWLEDSEHHGHYEGFCKGGKVHIIC